MRPAHRCKLTGLALSACLASVYLAPTSVAAQEEASEAEEAASWEAEPSKPAPEAPKAIETTPPVW
ncbi:MAG TPA: hypothetical protein VFN67_07035, partial [Polyangiales bacterium]|nr:hypothetical protein [Polyangiales bacterium]